MKTYLYLVIAIIAEVVATNSLKASEQFTKLWPSVLVVIGYLTAFYFLSLTLKRMDIGIVYALWSGIGIVLVSLVGVFLYKQKLDFAAILGMALIIAGVVVINLFSKSAAR